MSADIPIVAFDTSAHNRLVDDHRGEQVIEWINSQFRFRFAGLSIDELFACPSPRREKLFASCRRLQSGSSDCLLTSSLLIERLILAHFSDPMNFDWRDVNVRSLDDESLIRNYMLLNIDQASKQQSQFQAERRRLAKQEFVAARTKIQRVFKRHGESQPDNFQSAIALLKSGEGQPVISMAQACYRLVAKINIDEKIVKKLMQTCPPFRALRDIANVAGVETKILSYDDFCDSFLVAT
jgi:hypothetical protein